MARLTREDLLKVRKALDQLKDFSNHEPIVLVVWVVAGSNEAAKEESSHWQAIDSEGNIARFSRATEESAAQFQDRVGIELEAIACQEMGVPQLYFYTMHPQSD